MGKRAESSQTEGGGRACGERDAEAPETSLQRDGEHQKTAVCSSGALDTGPQESAVAAGGVRSPPTTYAQVAGRDVMCIQCCGNEVGTGGWRRCHLGPAGPALLRHTRKVWAHHSCPSR